jgi:hypothetical protein
MQPRPMAGTEVFPIFRSIEFASGFQESGNMPIAIHYADAARVMDFQSNAFLGSP